MNRQEAQQAWAHTVPFLAEKGVYPLPSVKSFVSDEVRYNYMAMDAQPSLGTDPNTGIPSFLTTFVDPQVYKYIFTPNKAAVIFGEMRKGTWLDETAMFPTIEYTGEVSGYGDFSENALSGANTNWPQRQSFLFQTIVQYGERELERVGLARINWVSELNQSAANSLNRAQNLTYFFGVSGLQNYGLVNDPGLSAVLAPAAKAYGGTAWISGGVVKATANEIYTDIESLFVQLVSQTQGTLDREAKLVLALSPTSDVALTATNSFNVNVYDLLKKNFPNLRIETAQQYSQTSATTPFGIAAGNMVQMFAEEIEGQDVGYCAFNEKMRSHPIIRMLSAFKQKITAGSFGAIMRLPVGISQMVGV